MDVDDSRIPLKEIRLHDAFNNLFPKRTHVLEALKKNIQANGFDEAFPLILAYGPWTDHDVLLDGHSRHQVCSELGLKTAPVVRRFFDTEDTALEYAVHIQRDRRNLTDGEILGCIEVLGARKKRGRPEKLAQSCANYRKGKSAAELASTLGISTRKLEMARTVADHGDAKMKEDMILKKTSINKAYQEIQAKRKEEKDMPKTQEDFISPPSAVSEHVSLRMAAVEKVEDVGRLAQENHDDLDTFNAAHDSACNDIHSVMEASMVPKCWVLKIIEGFDPHCLDYIIVGQGTHLQV